MKNPLHGIRRGPALNIVLGLVLVGLATGGYLAVGTGAPTTNVSARTATVRTGSVTATVTGSGNLASSRTASLAFGAAGTVTKLDVEVGDEVDKGQKLASIDTAAATQGLAAAQAQLTSSRAAYADAVSGASSSGTAAQAASYTSASFVDMGVDAAYVTAATSPTPTPTPTATATPTATPTPSATATPTAAPTATRSASSGSSGSSNSSGPSDVSGSGGSSGGTSSSSSESSAARIASAAVTVEQAKSAVQDAEDALAATTITAPFSGTVTAVEGAVGDTVSSSGTTSSSSSSSSTSSSGSGTSAQGGDASATTASGSSGAFLTMATLDSLQMTANVAEADIGGVETGQSVEVTLSASGETAEGTVTAVSPLGTTSSNVVQYPVTVTLEDPPAAARIGSSASVVITTGSAENALVLPTSAITTSGTRHTVTLLKNGVATPTQIETGLEGSTTTEVTGGISAGDTVQLPTTTGSTSTGVPGSGGAGGGFSGGGAAGGLGGGAGGFGGGR